MASQMQIGLIQFPGSNCDQDCISVFKRHFGIDLKLIWHTEASLPSLSGIILPGGFSYGDYLRSGALASHAPVMSEVKRFAEKGGPVIGVCNGFQILTEAKLLPGTLLKNSGQKFICKFVALKSSSGNTTYHKALNGKVTRLPVAHGQGRFHCGKDALADLLESGQVVVQYSSIDGQLGVSFNPNGSLESIAGIVSRNGRVFGLMPHPERATDSLVGGSEDGLSYWKAFLDQCG